MKGKTVYVAGPMRKHQFYNFPAFDAAKAMLEAMGYKVTSPADLDREIHHFDGMRVDPEDPCLGVPQYHDCVTGELRTFSMEKCIRADLDGVLGSDALFLLPGWEKSTGARAEVAVARFAGKYIFHGEGTLTPEAFGL